MTMSWFRVLVLITLCAVSCSFAQETQEYFAGLPPIHIPFPDGCLPSANMIDASGKIPAGLNSWNIVEIGAFDQCIAIKEKVKNSTKVIKGKYCVMKIAKSAKPKPSTYENDIELNLHPNLSDIILKREERGIISTLDPNETVGLLIGWCLPDTCNLSKIEAIFKIIGMDVKPVADGMLCQTEDDVKKPLDDSDWGVIAFFIVILVIIVISTIYDIYLHFADKRTAHLLLIAFSIKTNSEKLLSISKNPDQLPCLNGIRFISMMWVVLGHRYFISVVEPVINFKDVKDWALKDSRHMYIINAPVAVDTFFVLSGLLVGYGFCLAKSKGINFNIPMYYIHRYLRLTPVLAVVVLIHATILPHFGSGPFWPFGIYTLKDFCVKHWWAPLVYVQNYYNTDEMCIGQTWYLSVDFQLFLLSPLILIPLWKWPKNTLIVSTFLILGSMISSFVVTYHFGLPPFSLDQLKSQEYMDYYYITTHTRFGPWLMGLMLGYYLFKLKRERENTFHYKLNAIQVLLGWVIALAIMLACLFASHHLIMKDYILSNSFWNGLHRHAWTLGLCWVIFACTQGYGGVINSFLSWSPFQVLGKFTYTIYLVHLSTQYLMAAAGRSSVYFGDFYAMYKFWGDLFLSLGIAIILTLAFESPMITIEKIIFSFGTTKPNEEPVLPVRQSNNQQKSRFSNEDHIAASTSNESGETNKAFEAD